MPHIPLIFTILGGLLMGAGLGSLLLFNGQIGGVGGAFSSLVRGDLGEGNWKSLYIVGVVAGGVIASFVAPSHFDASAFDRSLFLVLFSGLLMGFGGKMCNGCTSGHGLCGISRFSLRSMVATGTFFGLALVSTFFLRHVARVF